MKQPAAFLQVEMIRPAHPGDTPQKITIAA
jgi:hypothetical protein